MCAEELPTVSWTESGGLAAHSIHNGLTVLEEAHRFWHGEKVAFGVISMLMREDHPFDVVEEVVDFCLEVVLPVALDDLGLDGVTHEELRKVAELACAEGEKIHNEPFDVYPETVLHHHRRGRPRRAVHTGEAELPAVTELRAAPQAPARQEAGFSVPEARRDERRASSASRAASSAVAASAVR